MTPATNTPQLDKAYNPADVEARIQQRWNDANAYHATPQPDRPESERYAIVIPPPNVTAALHMGHALNNTLQDILIRFHRMLGHNTLWMPGTDHAGIATQTVVDKRLKASGQPALIDYKKLELEGKQGREQFIAKVESWKEEYEKRITEQLVAMGCSCDYDRQRFTMDPVCAAAVREAFFQLFKAGLIYRGKRLVNWDPASQTALADDEVEMRDIDGHFWYMNYPIVDADGNPTGEHATVATTRPETMLGDTAVAINPKDPTNAQHIGQQCRLPIVNRIIPIIGDDYVVIPDPNSDDSKARFASGFLKVTPAHDPNDYEIGQRHSLPIINIMAPDGSISKDHGWPEQEWPDSDSASTGSTDPTGGTGFQPVVDDFATTLLGLDRYEAREAIVDWFRTQNLLPAVKPYTHAVGHSYRSHVPVEPYLSDQWYVKVTDERLAGAALDSIAKEQRSGTDGPVWKEGSSFTTDNGQLRFHPQRYAKTFQTWHENIRDWCISRQLWWGHRIPVWSRHFDSIEQYHGEAGTLQDELSDRLWAIEENHDACVTYFVSESDPERRFIRLKPSHHGPFTVYICLPDDTNESPDTYDHSILQLLERQGFTQDPDVLDTWFSSALWPISTLGWPNPSAFPNEIPEGDALLNAFNPSSTLCTAREIITLWVSRMVMFNAFFRNGDLPFRDVFIHAMIQDGDGQKMSKSLGNGVDPLDIIHSHGSDAMRYTLAKLTTQTQDVKMPVDSVCPHTGQAFAPKTIRTPAGHVVAAPIQQCPSDPSKKMVSGYGLASGEANPTKEIPLARNTSSKFDEARNFTNKLWNAGRFVLTTLTTDSNENETPSTEQGGTAEPTLIDRWILSRLATTHKSVTESLNNYRFNEYAQSLYDFFWRDLCDWYLEAIKPTVKAGGPAAANARQTLAACFDATLRMLHPAMPHITEELYTHLNATVPHRTIPNIELPPNDLLITAPWPTINHNNLIDEPTEQHLERMRQLIIAIRNVRNTYNVPPRQSLNVSIHTTPEETDAILAGRELIQTLAACAITEVGPNVKPTDDAAQSVVGTAELYIAGLVDNNAESDRLTKRLAELQKSRGALAGRLNNPGYTNKAPAHLVEETRKNLADTEQEIERIQQKLNELT